MVKRRKKKIERGEIREKMHLEGQGSLKCKILFPLGGKYLSLSLGGRNIKRGREKRENVEEKEERGKKK